MSNRASQFMAFDALKGHKEAIKSKERVICEKKELNDEDIAKFTYILKNIQKGNRIKVIHYDKDAYIETEGLVSDINLDLKYITVVKTKIYFDNINYLESPDVKDYDFFYNI